MFNVCPGCGRYAVEKAIDPDGPFAVCPHCGHRQPFRQLPLFMLTGPSGAGKTAVCLRLPAALTECVTLETDILWGVIPSTPDDNYRGYHDAWLRVAKNVGQSGRPVVLGGTATPEQLEACPERRYFTAVHYLALVCDDDLLAERLRARPAWRDAAQPEFIDRMLRFNAWLKAHAARTEPPLTLYDTSGRTVEESVEHVAAWARGRLP